jgi:hypothetical protein
LQVLHRLEEVLFGQQHPVVQHVRAHDLGGIVVVGEVGGGHLLEFEVEGLAFRQLLHLGDVLGHLLLGPGLLGEGLDGRSLDAAGGLGLPLLLVEQPLEFALHAEALSALGCLERGPGGRGGRLLRGLPAALPGWLAT